MALYEQLAIQDIQDAADVLRAGLRTDQAARRLREPRGFAVSRRRYRRHDRGGAAALEGGRPRQCDDQGPGHAGRRSGDPAADQRRDQRQRHAVVRAERVRSRSPQAISRASNTLAQRRRPEQSRQRRQLLRQPHRLADRQPVADAKLKTSTNAGRASAARRASRARSRSPTPSSPISATRNSSAATRWQALARKGAQTQRLLWASTSTKNPNYRDVIYVEELIGADTVNTIPPATFDAFRDHGRPRASLEEDLDDAHDTMDRSAKVGISMKDVTDKLLKEAVKLFADAFDKLLAAVDKGRKQARLRRESIGRRLQLARRISRRKVEAALEDWQRQRQGAAAVGRRCLAVDRHATKANWLGWLGITDDQLAHIAASAGASRRKSRRPASRTRCCSGWADRASVRK